MFNLTPEIDLFPTLSAAVSRRQTPHNFPPIFGAMARARLPALAAMAVLARLAFCGFSGAAPQVPRCQRRAEPDLAAETWKAGERLGEGPLMVVVGEVSYDVR